MTNSLNNKGFLALNAGSSSLKFALYLAGQDTPIMVGLCERIGSGGAVKIKDVNGELLTLPEKCDLQNHGAAMQVVIDALEMHFPHVVVTAAGHRVVHGGDAYDRPVLITPEVLDKLKSFTKLAPLHQPHNLSGINAAMEYFPDIPQLACFDTAFHRTQEFVNQGFAIPYRFYEEGVLRYGFHGLSYDYINSEIKRIAPELHQGKVVVAHLGNGTSLCAIEGGKSKASTMGFSVLDGLPMGTRCGQIDPGVIFHLLETEGMSVAEVSHMLYYESGLLGLSGGLSNDMRTLGEAGTEAGDRAIDYFVNKVRSGIASMAATMQGIDLLVFTAGIGENSALVRRKVCEGLAWLGVDFDDVSNTEGNGQRLISSESSKLKVMVIPTDEEIVIVRAARELVSLSSTPDVA
ncbi:MAG: acetate/propionate family kinase [Alcaligenaceae bacterium]|nr:acetate/propionate family kinase [Alcaligenaceae bacterium]